MDMVYFKMNAEASKNPDNKTPKITPPSKSKLKEPSKPSFSLLSFDTDLWASLRKKYVSTAKKIAIEKSP